MRRDPSGKGDDSVPLRPVKWTRIWPDLTRVQPVVYFQYLSIREVVLRKCWYDPYQITRCHNPEAHSMNHRGALKTVTKLTKFAESCDALCASFADSKLKWHCTCRFIGAAGETMGPAAEEPWGRSQNCEKRLLVSSCLSVRLSVCLSVSKEQLGSHWTDFHEISYLSISRKSVYKIQVSLNRTWKKGILHEDR